MKKIYSVLLLLAMVLSLTALTACAGDEAAAKAKVIEIDLTTEEYAFGVDKDQPELLTKVNAFIKKIMDDGTFAEICDHYFGDGEPVAVKSAELDTTKEQLVVATNAAFEPFEYKKGENYYGIDMEIAALLADELDMELVISNMDFDAVCLSVGQHKADIAMAGLTIKEDRKEHVTFSDPYYQASQKIIVKDGDTTFDDCKTAEDVLKKLQAMDNTVKIGYQNGTTGKMFVENEDDYASNNLKVSGKGYKNGSLAVQDLLNGNVKYVIIDAAPAECIVKALNGGN